MSSENGRVKSLRKRSSSIIGVFTKTAADLASVNLEAEDEIQARQRQIDTLVGEQADLKQVQSENQRFIDKFNDFLGL